MTLNLNNSHFVLREDPKTKLGKVLKKHLEEILEKVRDIVGNGKTYKKDLMEKAKEITKKLKDMHIDIGDHARDLLKSITEKAKDYWKKILEKFGLSSDFDHESRFYLAMEEDPKTELGKALKKHLEEILEKLQDIVDNGRTYKEDLMLKAKEIAQKLKDIHVDIGDHARELLNNIKEKAKDYWKKILEKFGLNSDIDTKSHFYLGTEDENLAKNLRGRLNDILDKIKDAFETRTTLGGRYLALLNEIWNEMKERAIPLGDRARELIEQLKGKTNGVWKRILEKILPS